MEQEYQKKLKSAEEAVKLIDSNASMGMGMGLSAPPAVLTALANRIRHKDLKNLRLYYIRSSSGHLKKYLSYDLLDELHPYCFFLNKLERDWLKRGIEEKGKKLIQFVPSNLNAVPKLYQSVIELDTFTTTVSSVDRFGYFSCGVNTADSLSGIRNAKKVIIEVNKNMPRVYGESLVHISEVDAIVENDQPLSEEIGKTPTKTDAKIVGHIIDYIDDGACLQIGMGGVPDILCGYLKDRRNLGIHSELLSMGLVDLIKCGAVNGSMKQINPKEHVFTIAYGDHDFYRYLDQNPSMSGYPSDYVNSPSIIAQNDHVVSVNSAIEIDIFGQVNSEFIGGVQFSGVGGQSDFIRGSQASKGGKSFIAMPSTTKNDSISKIVSKLSGGVTDLRMDVEYVVTEYGCVNLKGRSTEERAHALIGIAHPKFRQELTENVEKILMRRGLYD